VHGDWGRQRKIAIHLHQSAFTRGREHSARRGFGQGLEENTDRRAEKKVRKERETESCRGLTLIPNGSYLKSELGCLQKKGAPACTCRSSRDTTQRGNKGEKKGSRGLEGEESGCG